ncbi:hypothetical protein Tco_1170009, partial [Tanacetum coccineum]
VTDIHKMTKVKPIKTKASTRLEERQKTKPNTYSFFNGPTRHAGDPEVSYWLKGRGGDLRAQKDDLEFVINQGRGLEVGDAPHHREPSLLSYK